MMGMGQRTHRGKPELTGGPGAEASTRNCGLGRKFSCNPQAAASKASGHQSGWDKFLMQCQPKY